MSRYTAGEVRPGLDADPEAYIRETVRGYFHPVGTCALGSVVDAGGAVLGYENLYVADASVMPTMPRANTNLSTCARGKVCRIGGRLTQVFWCNRLRSSLARAARLYTEVRG